MSAQIEKQPHTAAPSPSSPNLHDIVDIHDRHHAPMASLKLATYAADAFRVLPTLEQQADRSAALNATIAEICPDWRNPGCLHDPADLIATALLEAVADLEDIFHRLHRLTQSPARTA